MSEIENTCTIEESEKDRAERLATMRKALDLEATQLGKKIQDAYSKSDLSKPFLENVMVNVQPDNELDVDRFMNLFWKTVSATPNINPKNPHAARLRQAVEAFQTNPPVVQLLFVLPDKVVCVTTGTRMAQEWMSALSDQVIFVPGEFMTAYLLPKPESSSFKDVDLYWKASCTWKNEKLGIQVKQEDDDLVFGDDHVF